MIFRVLGEAAYRLADPINGVEYQVTHVRRDRHELVCHLEVSCGLAGAATVDGILIGGSFNISSPRVRSERARQLAERARTGEKIDFAAHLEELCLRVMKAERSGSPSVLLRDVPKAPTADTLDVDGLRLLRDQPVIGFGDGGVLKSLLAMRISGQLANRGLSVLYADWELSAVEHRERFEQLFGRDSMPAVRYLRCDRPLIYEVERILRERTNFGIEYLICDSISFGCDGPPEAAEVAARYFQALRQIGCGSLLLAHVNKSERHDEKPFGSSFWHNGARSTWFFKRAGESNRSDTVTIGLYNKKSNLGPLRPAVGFEITFTESRTEVRRVDVRDVEELATSLPLRERMRNVLRRHPETLVALAESLETTVETVDRYVRRYKTQFTRVAGDDGVTRIALAERRTA